MKPTLLYLHFLRNDWLLIAIVLTLTFISASKFLLRTTLSKSVKYLFLFTIFCHFVLGFGMYVLFSNGIGIDAYYYYTSPFSLQNYIHSDLIGTALMRFLFYPFSLFRLSLWTIFLVGSFISYWGVLTYFKLIFREMNDSFSFQISSLPLILLFLFPSLHVWTGAFSKDAIVYTLFAFLAVDVYKTRSLNLRKSICVFAIFMVRPYVVAALLAVYVMLELLSFFKIKDEWAKPKSILLKLLVVTCIASTILYSLYVYTGLDSFTIASIAEWRTKINHVEINKQLLDPLTSNIFQRALYIITQPSIFNFTNNLQRLAAIENLVMGLIIVVCIVKPLFFTPRFEEIQYPYFISFCFLCAVFLLFTIAFFAFNIGYTSKLRIMFLPYLFIVLYFINRKGTSIIS